MVKWSLSYGEVGGWELRPPVWSLGSRYPAPAAGYFVLLLIMVTSPAEVSFSLP